MYGGHTITTATGAMGICNGILTTVGDFTYIEDTRFGPSSFWANSAATTGSQAGFRTNQTLTSITRAPSLYCSFAPIDVGTGPHIFFIGFHGSSGSFVSGTDPLNARDGIGLVLNGGFFRVAHNDESGSTFFEDFEPAIAEDALPHAVTITADTTRPSWFIELYSIGTSDTPPTLQGTLEVTTDIVLAQNETIAATAIMETRENAIHTWVIYRWEGLF